MHQQFIQVNSNNRSVMKFWYQVLLDELLFTRFSRTVGISKQEAIIEWHIIYGVHGDSKMS